jgi:predicted DNA-binding protein
MVFQDVLQWWHMSHTLTIRLTDELLAWLKETSRRTGVPMGRLIREQIERAREGGGNQGFLRHAGAIKGGPSDVSSRKGFSRS